MLMEQRGNVRGEAKEKEKKKKEKKRKKEKERKRRRKKNHSPSKPQSRQSRHLLFFFLLSSSVFSPFFPSLSRPTFGTHVLFPKGTVSLFFLLLLCSF